MGPTLTPICARLPARVQSNTRGDRDTPPHHAYPKSGRTSKRARHMGLHAWNAYDRAAHMRWRFLWRERYSWCFTRRPFMVLSIFFLWSHCISAQGITGPAPQGEATMVAQEIILRNFDKTDCPLVTAAIRLGDGSILAECSNRERFRVFYMQTVGNVAARCSALVKMGMKGC